MANQGGTAGEVSSLTQGEIYFFCQHSYQGGKTVNFQEIILKLQEFWAGQGCVLQQPYDVEKEQAP